MKRNRKIEYFKFALLPPKKQKSILYSVGITLNKNKWWVYAIVIGLVYLSLEYSEFILLFFLIIFTVYVTAINYKYFENLIANRYAKFTILDRKRQRKYFSRINGFTYHKQVELESALLISDNNTVAENYIIGEIGGINFWTADTRYEFTVIEGEITYTKHTATAVFLESSVPPIQFIRKDSFMEWFNYKMDNPVNESMLITHQFDKKYICRMPKDYERDVLYIFTPELLAMIYDYNPWLIEMYEERVIIHDRYAIETKKDYENLAEMIQILGSEFIENTRRYKDWRNLQ